MNIIFPQFAAIGDLPMTRGFHAPRAVTEAITDILLEYQTYGVLTPQDVARELQNRITLILLEQG